jgi:hypothetical protein
MSGAHCAYTGNEKDEEMFFDAQKKLPTQQKERKGRQGCTSHTSGWDWDAHQPVTGHAGP